MAGAVLSCWKASGARAVGRRPARRENFPDWSMEAGPGASFCGRRKRQPDPALARSVCLLRTTCVHASVKGQSGSGSPREKETATSQPRIPPLCGVSMARCVQGPVVGASAGVRSGIAFETWNLSNLPNSVCDVSQFTDLP